MPNPATVSIRKYNKELKVSADLRAELETSQENLKLARKKSRELRQQLHVAVAECENLATCQEELRLEKKINLDLKLRFKQFRDSTKRGLAEVRERWVAEFNEIQNATTLANEAKLKKMQDVMAGRMQEMESIHDHLKRENERLKHQISGNVKIPGNLERIREDPRVIKHPHVIPGGGAGSV